jgi:hypothetical protein
MALRQLQKDEWKAYFEVVSKMLLGMRAQIEVAALNIGDQIAAEWVPMLGVEHDPNEDVLRITLDGLDHVIPKPREIYVDEGEVGLSSFEVVDADNVRHIVQLRESLKLPPSPAVGGDGAGPDQRSGPPCRFADTLPDSRYGLHS